LSSAFSKKSENPVVSNPLVLKPESAHNGPDQLNREITKPQVAKALDAGNEPADFSALVKQMGILGKTYIDPYYERGAANPKKWWEKLRHWVKLNAMLVGGVSIVLFIVSLFVPYLWPLSPLFFKGSFLALGGLIDPIYEAASNFFHSRSPSKSQTIQLSVIAGLVTTFFAGPTALPLLGADVAKIGVEANFFTKFAHVFTVMGKVIANYVAKYFPSINVPLGTAEVISTKKAAAVPQTSAEFKEFPIGDARTVLSLLDDSQPNLQAQKNLIGISSNTRSIQQVLNVDFTTAKPTPKKGISKAFFVYGTHSNSRGGVNTNQPANIDYAIPTKGSVDAQGRKKIIYSRHEKIARWDLGLGFWKTKTNEEKQIQKAVDHYRASIKSLDTSIADRRTQLDTIVQKISDWQTNHPNVVKYLGGSDKKNTHSKLKNDIRAYSDLSPQEANILILNRWVEQEMKTLDKMDNADIYLVKASI
jgi:hypothetical protein